MSDRSVRRLDRAIWDEEEGRPLWENRGRCGVANGCFDLLHPGHLHVLRHLHEVCIRESLYPIVALNSDASVQTLKGPGRPIVPEDARAELIRNLRWPFSVVIFDEETPARLMEFLRPAVVVRGGPVDPNTVVRWYGSTVDIVYRCDDWSATGIMERREEGLGHR